MHHQYRDDEDIGDGDDKGNDDSDSEGNSSSDDEGNKGGCDNKILEVSDSENESSNFHSLLNLEILEIPGGFQSDQFL